MRLKSVGARQNAVTQSTAKGHIRAKQDIYCNAYLTLGVNSEIGFLYKPSYGDKGRVGLILIRLISPLVFGRTKLKLAISDIHNSSCSASVRQQVSGAQHLVDILSNGYLVERDMLSRVKNDTAIIITIIIIIIIISSSSSSSSSSRRISSSTIIVIIISCVLSLPINVHVSSPVSIVF